MPAAGGPRTVKREAGTSAKGVPMTTTARVIITEPSGLAELKQCTRATWAAGDYPEVARRGWPEGIQGDFFRALGACPPPPRGTCANLREQLATIYGWHEPGGYLVVLARK